MKSSFSTLIVPQHIFALVFIVLLTSCGGSNLSPNQLFQISVNNGKTELANGSETSLVLKNKKNKKITSVSYALNNIPIQLNNNVFILQTNKLGKQELSATISFNDEQVTITKQITVLAKNAPKVYTYAIKNSFPHDIKAFTQGLEFKNDLLYESTGKPGFSSLRKVNYTTGEVLQQTNLDASYFGEGITALDSTIYMLTWQNNVGFTFDATTLKQKKTFNYNKSKEGWGLCNDGEYIYKSDGTEKIWKLDPVTLEEVDHIEVYTNKSKLVKLNELEFVNGKIFANTWQFNKEVAVIIDPDTGAVEGVINFSGLKNKVKQHDELNVLNGIAYHQQKGTFFITGKYWDTLFEVTLEQK